MTFFSNDLPIFHLSLKQQGRKCNFKDNKCRENKKWHIYQTQIICNMKAGIRIYNFVGYTVCLQEMTNFFSSMDFDVKAFWHKPLLIEVSIYLLAHIRKGTEFYFTFWNKFTLSKAVCQMDFFNI